MRMKRSILPALLAVLLVASCNNGTADQQEAKAKYVAAMRQIGIDQPTAEQGITRMCELVRQGGEAAAAGYLSTMRSDGPQGVADAMAQYGVAGYCPDLTDTVEAVTR